MKKFVAILMATVMLFALSAPVLAAGQGSPDNQEVPPKLEKVTEGEGKTKNGKVIKVEEWDPKDSGFEDEDDALEKAMESKALTDALKDLKVTLEDFTGSSLASFSIEDIEDPVTVVFLYGDDGSPEVALYYYDEEWYEAEIEETDEESVYTLTFEDGFEGEVSVTLTDENEDKDK